MRKIIISILLIITTLSFGQDQFIIVDTLSLWNVHHGIIMGPDGLADPKTDILVFGGDTNINDVPFRNLMINNTYTISFRNETKKVIGYGMTNIYYGQELGKEDSEFTLYDFGLEIGDTIHYSPDNFSIVSDIDSVLIKDSYRKRLVISKHAGGYDYDEWIDGIGSINGFLYPMIKDFELSFNLTCFIYDGELLFANSNYSDCIPSEINNNKIEQVKVYPNPFQDELTISYPDLKMLEIRIYNTLGSLVYSNDDTNSDMLIKLDLPIGLYSLQLSDGSKMVYQKIIKNL